MFDPVWETLHQRGWGRWPSEHIVRFAALYKREMGADFEKRNRALDIGCGAGADSRMLFEEGFRVRGVDGSESAIANAKKHVPEGEFFHGDFEFIKVFAPEMFDIAIDDVSLCADPKNFERNLEIISRKLKKDGRFFSIVPNKLHREFKEHSPTLTLTEEEARALYGTFFPTIRVDTSRFTRENGSWASSTLLVECRK